MKPISQKSLTARSLRGTRAIGVPDPGEPQPSPNEQAILRRLARPGAYLMVTMREDTPPLYHYENGDMVKLEGVPLDARAFKRLCKWLDPVPGESLYASGPPQRWVAWKPPKE